MATNNSSTSTSAQEDYLDPSLRNSEDDMEMCALLDKKRIIATLQQVVKRTTFIPCCAMCWVKLKVRTKHTSLVRTSPGFSVTGQYRSPPPCRPKPHPRQQSVKCTRNHTISDGESDIHGGDSDDFSCLFCSSSDRSKELPSGYELLYHTPSLRSESFTELDLLSGFPSSTNRRKMATMMISLSFHHHLPAASQTVKRMGRTFWISGDALFRTYGGSRDLINSAINNLGMPRAFQNELRSFFEDVMFQVSRYKVYLYLYEPIKPNLHQPETVEH
ncbi:hypothetical protein Bbelb_438820 [Branchiostoma belcheri]|nr:hypothetical protein Bbelb_438820 [Branchiostoma belcheri]